PHLTSMSNQVAQKRPHIWQPQLPDHHLRRAPAALVLMARDLADAEPLLERLHQHFLLDRREVRRQAEPRADVASNRPEAVLAIGEAGVPPVIDREHEPWRADVGEERR